MVKSPQNLGESDTDKLKELVQQFPYFAIAQNLLVKSLHNTKHYEYDKQLKIAALQAGNRSVLYNLVHNLPLETESQDWSGQSIEQLALSDQTETFAVPAENSEIQIPEATPVQEPEIVNTNQIETSIDAPIESITSIEEVTPIVFPEPIVQPIIPEPKVEKAPERNPEIIYEEEKLIEANGTFEKFIPKTKKIVNTDESILPEPEDELFDILPDFDISSLNGLPVNPIIEIKSAEEPAETVEKTVQTEEIIQLEEKVEIIKPESNESAVSPAFYDWLKNKENTPEEDISIPVENEEVVASFLSPELPKPEIEEDKTFVENFQQKISNQASEDLAQEIKKSEHWHYEIADAPSENISHTEVVENISSKKPVFKIEKPVEVVEIIVEPKPISENKETSSLSSLENYEVNEFLAPLYLQVKYNDSLFELDFEEVFERKNPPKNLNWTEPFVFLNPETPETPVKPIPEPVINIKPVENLPIFEDLSYESSIWVESQQKNNSQDEIPEIIIPKKESSLAAEEKIIKKSEPEVKPKIADLPPPKIARDPGTVESILDKFIRENPSIARPKSEFYSPVNMAKQSAEESEEIVSETLANIYTKQGLYKKAVQMYEKLGLHYPEKFTYFASLIEQIKSAHNIE